jgi:hypothetical protein
MWVYRIFAEKLLVFGASGEQHPSHGGGFYEHTWQCLKRQRTGAVQNLADFLAFHLGRHFAGI